MQTGYETILDNVLSNMHQLQHGRCQESRNQKNWKNRRILFERWSPDALIRQWIFKIKRSFEMAVNDLDIVKLTMSDYTVNIRKCHKRPQI